MSCADLSFAKKKAKAKHKAHKISASAKKKAKQVKPYVSKKACPKCGPGIHLADHKNRSACGKCGYFEKK